MNELMLLLLLLLLLLLYGQREDRGSDGSLLFL